MMKVTQEDIKPGQTEMRSIVNAWMTDKDARKKMTACHEAMEADTETEPYSGMMQSVAEHQVALKEDAVVKPVKGWRKRHRGRKPAAGQCGEAKKMTRKDCGAGRKLAAACRKVASCVTVAWRKRNLLIKTGTHENCGLRSKLTAAKIKMTHHARVAWRRKNFVTNDWTRNQIE
jgi:hypothetical protein